MISASQWCAPSRTGLHGIATAALVLDPIIPSTPIKVLSGFSFEEETTGVEVTVRTPERDMGTITRVGQDYELQQLAS